MNCGFKIQKWQARQAAQKAAEQREAARAEKAVLKAGINGAGEKDEQKGPKNGS